MKHVVTQPNRPRLVANGRLEIHQIPVWQDNLVWLAVCTETGEAAVIDGPDAEPILAYCKAHGINWTTILNTHVHHDHIGVNRTLEAMGRLSQFRVVGAAATMDAIPGITDVVRDGDAVRIGDVDGSVWLTEGHIDGHISYIFGDALFCGDTLFAGGCGYLFDGPAEKMHASLTRLASLPGDTLVFCAHEYTQDNLKFAWSVEPGNRTLLHRIRSVWAERSAGRCVVPSTIDVERSTNPFLRVKSPEIVRAVGGSIDELTNDGAEVFARLRALKDSKAYRALEDADLPVADGALPR
ncbi:MAG: hydroxyacylglutathione hydrolase [Myxococcota bacterium]|nr:hydroxyacylglutathione hydrolase [Myxococcota bacterium]